ncbi:MAG: hypothetical protein ACKOX3_00730 [Bacteroidota bacterium]
MKYLLLFLFVPLSTIAQNNKDTSIFLYKGNISATYSTQKNWCEQETSFITLQTGGCFDYRKTTRNKSCVHHLNTEVSYLYFPDSIWKTNTDFLKVNFQWNKHLENHWQKNNALYISTRYLNKYLIKNNSSLWQEGFLNPMEITYSYGYSKPILKFSYVSLSFCALRLTVNPPCKSNSIREVAMRFENNCTLIGQYGFQAQCLIHENVFKEIVTWTNESRFYINQLNEQGILFDLHNCLAIKIYKHFELKIDTKWQYDYVVCNKMRFKQEALFGFFYDNSHLKRGRN